MNNGTVPAAMTYSKYEPKITNIKSKEPVLVDSNSDISDDEGNPYIQPGKNKSKRRKAKNRGNRFNDHGMNKIGKPSKVREEISQPRNGSLNRKIPKPHKSKKGFGQPGGLSMFNFDRNEGQNQYNYEIPEDRN
mmetsp:Transcript_19253/g.21564  ORF Transcript_19253/g.21564 Transcript_19253/m.21564 type:complete len:134 (+) Transcript_19253:327-728(+)